MVVKGDAGRWVASLLVAVLGVIGLILAAGALDSGIYVFGLGMAVWAVLFQFQMLKQHFDAAERR